MFQIQLHAYTKLFCDKEAEKQIGEVQELYVIAGETAKRFFTSPGRLHKLKAFASAFGVVYQIVEGLHRDVIP